MPRNILVVSFFGLIFIGCSSMLKTDIPLEKIEKNDEFEKLIEVKQVETPKENRPTAPKQKIVAEKKPKPKLKKNIKTKPPKKAIKKPVARQPRLEDDENFKGRRPKADPFRVGEKVVLDLTYLNMTAGELGFEVLPFVEVNNNTAYHFKVSIISSTVFSYVYKLDNSAETYVDYKTLLPYSHAVHIKESKQIKEARSFFDWKKLEGSYWEKKITKKGEENKKNSWKIKNFSQNLISTLFYLRVFTLTPGKVIEYRVADAGKQHVVSVDVLKREVIKNDLGTYKTIKVKVNYKTDGTFAQAGDIYFWITDDARKFLVKIRSKIKIGSLYGELKSLKP